MFASKARSGTFSAGGAAGSAFVVITR
jgi:hypothetical protein